MRTILDIDEKLLKQALTVSRARTKKEPIHRSLEALIREHLLTRSVDLPLWTPQAS